MHAVNERLVAANDWVAESIAERLAGDRAAHR
jgi:hypothetical protein